MANGRADMAKMGGCLICMVAFVMVIILLQRYFPVQPETDAAKLKRKQEVILQKRNRKAACRQDIKCWESRYPDAKIACRIIIEQAAKYAHRWTNSWMEDRFSRVYWKDFKAGNFSYYGDKVQFQNMFGAWQHMRYRCHYNPSTDKVSIEIGPR